MANGPFGNPLSTGIALSFEVDMTPYRQMHARKMANIEEKKKERKKQQAELQDILKNVTVDTSKIHERYKDDAMNEYASTIDDVMKMYKEGNVAGVYNRINKFNNGINSYVSATDNFKNYVKSKGENTFRNDELIRAMNNVEGVSDDQLLKMFQQDIDYSNGLFNFTVIDRPDVVGYANKLLQGVDKQYVRDESGNIVPSERFGDKGTKLYKTSIPDVDQFITETANWLKSSAGGNRLLMQYGNITPAQLDERQEDGRQLRDVLAEDYVRKNLSNKLYGEKEKEPWKPESKTDGSGRPNVMGKVQIAEAQTSPISREAFNIDEYRAGVQPVIESEVLKIINAQGADNEKGVITELKNKIQDLAVFDDVNDWVSGENRISVSTQSGSPVEINLNDKAAAAKKIAEVLSASEEADLKSIGNKFKYDYATPSSVIKDFEKTAAVSTFGGDVRKSYEIPKGEIYIVGSKGAKKMTTKNAINVAGSLFKSFNRDTDGDVWHGIDFPVEEESAIKSLLEQALGRESIDDFVKSNGIPKTFYVPETQKNVATFLTTDSQGKITPEFLDERLREIGVYGAGTSSSESEEVSNPFE